MDLGITVAESKDGKRPTGRWVVVKEDKISQIIGDEDILEKTLEKRKVFVDSKLMDMLLGVAKGDKDGDKI
jgi:tmRNA-binding protein